MKLKGLFLGMLNGNPSDHSLSAACSSIAITLTLYLPPSSQAKYLLGVVRLNSRDKQKVIRGGRVGIDIKRWGVVKKLKKTVKNC